MISDVIDFGVLIGRPRDELWHLLAQPQWYARFFRGVGSVTRIFDASIKSGEAYSARVGGSGGIPLCEVRFRLRETRHESEFVLEGADVGWCAAIRLIDNPETDGTRVSAALFKVSLLSAGDRRIDNTAVTAWLRDGIVRAAEYLASEPTAITSNSGHLPNLGLSVARKMLQTGVFDVAARPDRGVRQLHSLRRWGFTLAGGYAAAQAHTPHAIAIVDEYGSHTFAQIHHRADRLAAGLYALDIRAGSTVGVLARNHAAMVEAMVGCGKLGLDAVLVNTGLSARQLVEIAGRQQLRAIFVDDEFEDLVHPLPRHILRITTREDSAVGGRVTMANLIGDPTRSYPRPAEPGRQIVLTSGTSGTPRAALRPRAKGFGAIAAMLSKLPLQMNERMLIAAPLFHSWGFGLLQISTPIRATVILQDRFDPEACLAAVATHRCTSLMVVPIMLQRILDLPPAIRARYDTSSLRIIASSGSTLPGSLAYQVMDVFGEVLYNFYGSTEVSWATVADPADLRAAPSTAGRPPLGTRVAILDEDGVVLPVGAVGRIYIGNEMLFDGYTNAADPKVTDGMMDTGDLGYLDADDRLFVAGRDDEMIISGGENVFPRPVEDALAMLPQVSEVAVIGVPDEEFGQRLAAYVVPHIGATLDVDMLRHYIRNRLNRFSVPRDFLFLESLPRNATGKILRRVLVSGDFDPA